MSHSIANHSITTADRGTHLKIVVVALLAAIAVVAVGITAHLRAFDVELAGVNPKPPTKVGVVRAAKPVVWTANQQIQTR